MQTKCNYRTLRCALSAGFRWIIGIRRSFDRGFEDFKANLRLENVRAKAIGQSFFLPIQKSGRRVKSSDKTILLRVFRHFRVAAIVNSNINRSRPNTLFRRRSTARKLHRNLSRARCIRVNQCSGTTIGRDIRRGSIRAELVGRRTAQPIFRDNPFPRAPSSSRRGASFGVAFVGNFAPEIAYFPMIPASPGTCRRPTRTSEGKKCQASYRGNRSTEGAQAKTKVTRRGNN